MTKTCRNSGIGQCERQLEGLPFCQPRCLRYDYEPTDTERLDWLNANPGRVGFSTGYLGAADSWMYVDANRAHRDALSLRHAIDAAMPKPDNGDGAAISQPEEHGQINGAKP